MGHSYTNVLYHIVFSSKERQPWLDTGNERKSITI